MQADWGIMAATSQRLRAMGNAQALVLCGVALLRTLKSLRRLLAGDLIARQDPGGYAGHLALVAKERAWVAELIATRRELHNAGIRRPRAEHLPPSEAEEATLHRPVSNSHWPGIPGHGLFVSRGIHHGLKRPYTEVEIYPPDPRRTQFAWIRVFATEEQAARWARIMWWAGWALIEHVEREEARRAS